MSQLRIGEFIHDAPLGMKHRQVIISSSHRDNAEDSVFVAKYTVKIPRLRASAVQVSYGIFAPPLNVKNTYVLWMAYQPVGPPLPLQATFIILSPGVYSVTDLADRLNQEIPNTYIGSNTVTFKNNGNRLSVQTTDPNAILYLYDTKPSFALPIILNGVSDMGWSFLGFDDAFPNSEELVRSPANAPRPPPLISKYVQVSIRECTGSNSIESSSQKIIGGINAVVPINIEQRTTSIGSDIISSKQYFNVQFGGKTLDSLSVTIYDDNDDVAHFQDDHLIGLTFDIVDHVTN